MFDWLFKKTPVVAPEPELELSPGKKLCLIDLRDYPGSRYSAYWEIGVLKLETRHWRWVAKIVDRQTGVVLDRAEGEAGDETEARRQSQTWVLGQMTVYRTQEQV